MAASRSSSGPKFRFRPRLGRVRAADPVTVPTCANNSMANVYPPNQKIGNSFTLHHGLPLVLPQNSCQCNTSSRATLPKVADRPAWQHPWQFKGRTRATRCEPKQQGRWYGKSFPGQPIGPMNPGANSKSSKSEVHLGGSYNKPKAIAQLTNCFAPDMCLISSAGRRSVFRSRNIV